MDLVVDELDLVLVLDLEEVLCAVALGVEVAVVDAEVAEHLLLARTDAHLRVAEDEVVGVVEHAADGARVPRVAVRVVERVVQLVGLPAVEGNDEGLLVHHRGCVGLQLAGVVAGDEGALRFDDEDEVGVAVDELVEVGLVVALVVVQLVGLLDVLLHVRLDRVHQELLLRLPLLQDLPDEERAVLDEAGRAESARQARASAFLQLQLQGLGQFLLLLYLLS